MSAAPKQNNGGNANQEVADASSRKVSGNTFVSDDNFRLQDLAYFVKGIITLKTL